MTDGEPASTLAAGKVQILIGMADSAEMAGNQAEAISYFNRVLEEDPTVSEAWLGKGRAAGWLSTLGHLRLQETVVAFGHAIATAGDDREEVAGMAVADLTAIGGAVRDMAWRHYADHAMVAGAWETCRGALAAVLDAQFASYEWHAGSRQSLALTITVCKLLLDHGDVGPVEGLARAMYDGAVDRRRAIDPTYEPPALAGVTTVDRVAAEVKEAVDHAQAEDAGRVIGGIIAFVVLVILGVVIGAQA